MTPPATARVSETMGIGTPGRPGPSSVGTPAPTPWRLASVEIPLDRPVVMGILNLTPDSFSDGGVYSAGSPALRRAEELVAQGADIVDVGGESTRPGADEVPVEVELGRVLPFVREAARILPVPVSIDTRKSAVARGCVDAGAQVVNDVSGLRHDPAMKHLVASAGVGVVLMHSRGDPGSMAREAVYGDVVEDVLAELAHSVGLAREAGVPPDRIVVDPGIGFAKTAEQSLRLLAEVGRLGALGHPVLVGPSRKSFIGRVLGLPPDQRVEGTVAACVAAYLGGARLFRVHDVGPVKRALTVAHAIVASPAGASLP